MGAAEVINSPADFSDTPEGWYQRWKVELDAAHQESREFHDKGRKIVKLFRDDREGDVDAKQTKWLLFSANTLTILYMLYGKPPGNVEIGRRFADADDSDARVLGEMLERMCNCDMERSSDNTAATLRMTLINLLLPGIGIARLRFDPDLQMVKGKPAIMNEETGEEDAPAVPDREEPGEENVEIEFVQWDDFRWSAGSRTYSEWRWCAFKARMSRPSLERRFGKEMAALVPMNSPSTAMTSGNSDSNPQRADPWARAEVWEIWDKDSKEVFWFVEGMGKILDRKKDPLEIENFWPLPKPMRAIETPETFIPRSFYAMCQDIYEEINTVSTRITTIEKAIAVRGIYDASSAGVKLLLKESGENDLIPVEGWYGFTDKGGLQKQIAWLPLDIIVQALDKLREYRGELMNAANQISGIADIIRGEASAAGTTATENRMKGRFASVRMQALSDEFARFASDLQRIKVEIIAKHFRPETIIRRSNVMFTPDAQVAMRAIQTLKSKWGLYRVEVKPESLAQADFAALKEQRTEFLATVGGFIQQAAPIAQALPGSMPILLNMLKWVAAALPGSSSIQGELDRAISLAQKQAQQPQAPPPPDPKLQAEQLKLQGTQMKAQADMEKERFKLQSSLITIQAETDAHAQQERDQAQSNIEEARVRASLAEKSAAARKPTGGNGV